MHRRVALLLLAAGFGANHFSTLLVVYRSEFGYDSAALGLLFGAYALGLLPGLLLAGRASDRYGRRRIVLPASVLAIASSALLACGGLGFSVLLGGRLLYGLAMGCMMGPGSVWLQELSPAALGPRRATLALSAGFGLGPLISGLVAEWLPYPTVTPYAIHIVIMALGLFAARAVPETAHVRVSASDSLNAGRGLGARELALLAQLLPVAPWAFGFAAVTMAVLPGLLRAHVARPVVYTGCVILTTLVSGVLVQPLTTRIGRRADLLGLGAGAVGIWIAAHAVAIGAPGLAFLAATLVGVGYGLVMTTGLREVSVRASSQVRGTAVGAYYVLTYLGFAVPFLHASIAKHYGDAQTLEMIAASALGCLFIRAHIERRSAFQLE